MSDDKHYSLDSEDDFHLSCLNNSSFQNYPHPDDHTIRTNHTFCLLFSVSQRNVKEMMDVSGIRVLVDLLTLAHLHTSRAVVPLQVICHVQKILEDSNFGQKVSENETARNCCLSIVNFKRFKNL